MDEFILRAGAGGLAIALLAGTTGTLMLWRGMTFFGAAIAEAAVLGVVLGFLMGIGPLAATIALCIGLALLLETLMQNRQLSGDTLIGIVGHGALALALVLFVYLQRVRVDLLGYLFGDILAVTWSEVCAALAIAAIALGAIAVLWRPLLSATAEPDIARAEGMPVRALSIFYSLVLASVIALGLKLVGALLIVSLLVMPAAAARSVARAPAQMAVLATVIAALSVAAGLALSLYLDWPAGPAIAVAAAAGFALSLAARR